MAWNGDVTVVLILGEVVVMLPIRDFELEAKKVKVLPSRFLRKAGEVIDVDWENVESFSRMHTTFLEYIPRDCFDYALDVAHDTRDGV